MTAKLNLATLAGHVTATIIHSMKFRPGPKKSWWIYMILIIDLDLISMILLTYYIIYYSVFVIHNGVILLVWWQNTSVSIGRPQWGTTRCEIHHSMKFRPDPKKSWWLYMILIIDLDLISMILLTYYVLYQLVLSILYRIIYKLDG